MTDTAPAWAGQAPTSPDTPLNRPAGMMLAYNGHTWTEANMTAGHAMAVEAMIGATMEAAIPTASIVALAAWITVLESSTSGRDVEDLATEVALLPVATLLACIVQV